MAEANETSIESSALRERLDTAEKTYRATLNLLEDFGEEKSKLQLFQQATMNLLDDFDEERRKLQSIQKATVNLLEDMHEEHARMDETQRAVFNILEDVEVERIKAEHARALAESANQELEHFAYVASHDLQEPLRAVSSFAQLLARRYQGKLDPDADEYIGFVVEGAKRMQMLITNLLALSRIGTRGQPFAPVDVEAVLQAAKENLAAAIEESEAVITHDPLPTVMGDQTQLTQLFQNLFGNAIKFRRLEETPRIHVSAAWRDGGWRLFVRDNGIGIDPQFFERIFVIFQRLHGREEYPGTGIGLALCKKIVERHRGRLWVESEPGNGSTFHFNIPDESRKV